MTTSSRNKQQQAFVPAGFTLVELMISMSLSAMILAAVLTAFIMIARSSMRVVNYSVMESQTRRAFEQLAIDARMANGFSANATSGVITSFTLSIPSEDLLPNRTVTYGYDTSNASDKKLFMVPGSNPAATTGRLNLITGLKDLTIYRYTSALPLALMTTGTTTGVLNSSGIKHLQLSVSVARTGSTIMEATQVIRSTAFTLRNL